MTGGVPLLRDATVIGVLGQTAGTGFEWECYDRNDVFWGGKEFKRTFDIGYAGVQLGGVSDFAYGTGLQTGWRFEMERVSFVNFTGIDACGRANAAINNQAAGIVESDGGFEKDIGLATCYPTHMRELDFPHSPPGRARVTLHDGGTWTNMGVTLGSEKGHARCYLIDRDGTLLDQATSKGWVIRSSVDYFWNPDVVADCKAYRENQDDDPDFSECMWFLRDNDILLDAVCDAERRGLPYNPDSMRARNNCTTPDVAFGDAAQNWNGANAWVCQGADFLNLKFDVPKLVVSGSEVLWAPVVWSTVRSRSIGTSLYDGDETVVTYQESLEVKDGPATGSSRRVASGGRGRYNEDIAIEQSTHGCCLPSSPCLHLVAVRDCDLGTQGR